jgi:hypothetical protein
MTGHIRREYKNYVTWKSAQQASELLVNVIGDDRPCEEGRKIILHGNSSVAFWIACEHN